MKFIRGRSAALALLVLAGGVATTIAGEHLQLSKFSASSESYDVKELFAPAYNRSVDELCKMYRAKAIADAESGIFPPKYSIVGSTEEGERVNFAFIKFGKVGGTSLQAILSKYFKRVKREALGDGVETFSLKDDIANCPCRADNGIDVEGSWTTTNATAYFGHQSYEAHRYVPGKMHYLVLTRDPLDQYISAYFYKNPQDYTNNTDAGMADILMNINKYLTENGTHYIEFSNGFSPESPLTNLVRMACDRPIVPDFPEDTKLVCDVGREHFLADEGWANRMRDIALNRIFFPPPNVYITAANLVGHFQETTELLSKRLFQEPLNEEDIAVHKFMPLVGHQEKHYWRPSVNQFSSSIRAQFRAKFAVTYDLDEALRCKFRTDAEILGIKIDSIE